MLKQSSFQGKEYMNRQDTGVLVVKILCANSRERVRIIEKPDALGLRIY